MNKSENFIKISGLIAGFALFIYSIVILYSSKTPIIVYGFGDFLNNFHFSIPAKVLYTVFIVLFFAIYFASFLTVTKEKRLLYPDKKSFLLLIIMSLSGFAVCAPLIYITNLVAGFILKIEFAIIWIVANVVMETTIYILTPNSKFSEIFEIVKYQGSMELQLNLSFYVILAFHIFSYFIGVILSKEMKQRYELERINAELNAVRKMHDADVRTAERVFISRELHDSIGHHLTAINTNLQLASKLCSAEAKEPIEDAYSVSRLMLNDVRDIVSSLRENGEIVLKDAINTMISPIRYPSVNFKMEEELVINDPITAHTLFRCAQEIVTNSIKHSGAKDLYIYIFKSDTDVILEAKDNGKGVSQIECHNGLTGMKERIKELHGEISYSSKYSKGFQIKIKIPYIGDEND